MRTWGGLELYAASVSLVGESGMPKYPHALLRPLTHPTPTSDRLERRKTKAITMTTPVDALEPVPAAIAPAASTTIQNDTDDTAPATAPVAPSKAQQVMEQQAQRKENEEREGGNVGVDTWHGGGRKVGMDVLVKAE